MLDLIRDQIANDLSDAAATKYPRELLSKVHQILVVEINKAATFKTCPILGFNPDYLMYEPTSADAQMRAEFDGRVDDLCAFYRYYHKRAWTKTARSNGGENCSRNAGFLWALLPCVLSLEDAAPLKRVQPNSNCDPGG